MKIKKRGKKNKRRFEGMRVCLCEDDAKACVRYARARSIFFSFSFYEIFFKKKILRKKKGRREGREQRKGLLPHTKLPTLHKSEKRKTEFLTFLLSVLLFLFLFTLFLPPLLPLSLHFCSVQGAFTQIPTSKINLLHALFLFPLLKLSLTQFISRKQMEGLIMNHEMKPLSKFRRICVFCGSSQGKKRSYQDSAIELGKELVKKKKDKLLLFFFYTIFDPFPFSLFK